MARVWAGWRPRAGGIDRGIGRWARGEDSGRWRRAQPRRHGYRAPRDDTSNVTDRGGARAGATRTLADAGVPTPALDADVLLAHVLRVPKEQLVAHPAGALTPAQAARLGAILAERAT